MIDETIIKRLRAWSSIIGSGISIGFFIGMFFLLSADIEHAKTYFWISFIGGFIVGLLIAVVLNKKGSIKDGFEPLNRSQDLDNYQDRFKDLHQDDKVLELVPKLNNKEFISLICFRYPQMLIETKNKFKQELLKRDIDKRSFYNHFSSLETFRTRNENHCPKCGYHDYKPLTKQGELNCELCGYYEKLENPDKFINRIKKTMGYYYDIGINKEIIELELYAEKTTE